MWVQLAPAGKYLKWCVGALAHIKGTEEYYLKFESEPKKVCQVLLRHPIQLTKSQENSKKIAEKSQKNSRKIVQFSAILLKL
jgi:hypothetical protein